MSQQAKALAVVRTYRDLIAVLRSVAEEKAITRHGLDTEGRMALGYSGKLLGPLAVKNLGPNSLGALLSVLDLDIVVVERSART